MENNTQEAMSWCKNSREVKEKSKERCTQYYSKITMKDYKK